MGLRGSIQCLHRSKDFYYYITLKQNFIKLGNTSFFINSNYPNHLFHLCVQWHHDDHQAIAYYSEYSERPKYNRFSCRYCKIMVPRVLQFSFSLDQVGYVWCTECLE